jgi:hypothetical protein
MSNMMVASNDFDTKALAAEMAKAIASKPDAFKREGPRYIKLPSAQRPMWTDSEGAQIETGTKVVVNPMAMEHGWTAFHGGKNILEVMANRLDALPEEPSELADGRPFPAEVDPRTGQPKAVEPQINYVMVVAFEDGTKGIIRGGSTGFRKAVDKLGVAIRERVMAGESKLCPVISLSHDSYSHAIYGKIVFPVFTITAWV